MKKLKLNKVTISNLTQEESASIVGGRLEAQAETSITLTTVPITISIVTVVASSKCAETAASCLSCEPGTADSCGLCTTNYMC